MDRIIERLGNCSTQELQDISNIIAKEITRRNKEEEKTALLNFEKAFRKYVKINPNFTLYFVCSECGVEDGADGEDVLEQFFTDQKRLMS
jgi:hypothetical protein